jgi:hypothetical protein
MFHISFISFNQSLQVNGPLDIEHVTVDLFTKISQGKTIIMHKYKYKGCMLRSQISQNFGQSESSGQRSILRFSDCSAYKIIFHTMNR